MPTLTAPRPFCLFFTKRSSLRITFAFRSLDEFDLDRKITLATSKITLEAIFRWTAPVCRWTQGSGSHAQRVIDLFYIENPHPCYVMVPHPLPPLRPTAGDAGVHVKLCVKSSMFTASWRGCLTSPLRLFTIERQRS